MLDQAFTQLRTDWALRDVVDDCIVKWCLRHGRKVEDMEPLLAFSHLHSDHYAAINQFAGLALTRATWDLRMRDDRLLGNDELSGERVTLDLEGGTFSYGAARAM